MLKTLRSWLTIRRRLTAMDRADRWLQRAKLLHDRLSKRTRKLEGIKRLFEQTAADCQEPIKEVEYLLSQYEPTMEAVRNELQIVNDNVIPTLTAQHRLLLERAMADVEYQVRRQTAYSLKED
jgi:uncharacterized membrane protein YccC